MSHLSNPTSDEVKMDMELDDMETPKKSRIEEKTLEEYGFVTGDLLSVSLYIPEPRVPRASGASVAPEPRGEADRNGQWARGETVPSAGAGANGRSGGPGDRRVSGAGGAMARASRDSFGIRGAAREDGRNGFRRRSRSRSPDRRESFGRR